MPVLLLLWFFTNCLLPLQRFSFQDQENAQIKIAPDRTILDPKDPDHKDKMPKNTRAASAIGKTSSRHSIQDRSDDNSDSDCQMFLDLTPLGYALSAMPSPDIPDEYVVEAALLNQGPPPGTCASKKCGVWPQPEPVEKTKRKKVGMPLPKKQRLVALG
jgi:hypothetical protein